MTSTYRSGMNLKFHERQLALRLFTLVVPVTGNWLATQSSVAVYQNDTVRDKHGECCNLHNRFNFLCLLHQYTGAPTQMIMLPHG